MSRIRMTRSIRWFFVAALVATAFAALASTAGAAGSAGQVYTITNEANGNRVAVFDRSGNGDLSFDSYVNSGGNGTGAGLGSQGAIILSGNSRWLFAVNAGSDSISSFRVTGYGLTLVDTVPSNGDLPVSLTLNGDLLYVLNAGTSPNISGFRVDNHGMLSPIAGSTQAVTSATSVQIGFSPDGGVLVVAGKASNTLDSFVVDQNGVAGPAQTFASNADVPYGFAFDNRGHLIVSEASGFVTSVLGLARRHDQPDHRRPADLPGRGLLARHHQERQVHLHRQRRFALDYRLLDRPRRQPVDPQQRRHHRRYGRRHPPDRYGTEQQQPVPLRQQRHRGHRRLRGPRRRQPELDRRRKWPAHVDHGSRKQVSHHPNHLPPVLLAASHAAGGLPRPRQSVVIRWKSCIVRAATLGPSR